MITLFHNVTHDLTPLEKDQLIPLLEKLLDHTNNKNRFSAKRIIAWYIGQGFPISKIRLCKMIAFLRISNAMAPNVIIGASNGYYLTGDPQIIQDQIDSLQGRCDAMRCVIDSLQAQRLSLMKME